MDEVRATISRAADRAARDPASIRIVAVTKTVPVERITQALALGLRRLGENRVQEAVPKIDALAGEDCEWHLIGHLQTNKARQAAARFSMIESIDSLRIVDVLAARLERSLDVLIEVNIAQEPQKTGVRAAEADPLVAAVLGTRLRLRGLMTMAPLTAEPEAARPIFRALRSLRDQLSQRFGVQLPELSMGMTDDYPIAVEEGATMLRLGRALFGPR